MSSGLIGFHIAVSLLAVPVVETERVALEATVLCCLRWRVVDRDVYRPVTVDVQNPLVGLRVEE